MRAPRPPSGTCEFCQKAPANVNCNPGMLCDACRESNPATCDGCCYPCPESETDLCEECDLENAGCSDDDWQDRYDDTDPDAYPVSDDWRNDPF